MDVSKNCLQGKRAVNNGFTFTDVAAKRQDGTQHSHSVSRRQQWLARDALMRAHLNVQRLRLHHHQLDLASECFGSAGDRAEGDAGVFRIEQTVKLGA